MIMKKNLLLIIISIFILQCKKTPFRDLSGDYTLKGIVMVYDTLGGVVNKTPGDSLRVYLKYDNGGTNYLNHVTTNDQGRYSFTGIEADKGYIIYAESKPDLKYYGQITYPAKSFEDGKSDTLKLFPSQTAQNGIHLIVRDSIGGPVPKLTAWVFNSAVLFAADSSAGKLFDISTNEYGIGNKYNIAAGTYYLRIKTKIGNLSLSGENTVVVTESGIQNVNIILKSIPPTNRNGIELTVWDIYNTPVEGAKVYFYRSNSVFFADTGYQQSLFTLTSNSAGLASSYIIDSALYYYKALKVVGADSLKYGPGSISVDKTQVSKETITLQ